MPSNPSQRTAAAPACGCGSRLEARGVIKPLKSRAYLVSVSQKREAVRVYALLASTADEALAAIAAVAPPRAKVEIVGGLSRDLVKRLRLKRGETRLV